MVGHLKDCQRIYMFKNCIEKIDLNSRGPVHVDERNKINMMAHSP